MAESAGQSCHARLLQIHRYIQTISCEVQDIGSASSLQRSFKYRCSMECKSIDTGIANQCFELGKDEIMVPT